MMTTVWVREQIDDHEFSMRACEILEHRKTRYQEMVVVKSPVLGIGLILDGKWQLSEVDEFIYHEALVHTALTLHGHPLRVAILGGGDGVALREVLRWDSTERIALVEIDADVINASRVHLKPINKGSLEDPQCEIYIDDASSFLVNSNGQWDVIIADITDPLPGGPAEHLFSSTFFATVSRALRAGGIFVTQAGPLRPNTVNSFQAASVTLGCEFHHTLQFTASLHTYLGSWGFLIGSKSQLPRPTATLFYERCPEHVWSRCRFLDGRIFESLFAIPLFAR